MKTLILSLLISNPAFAAAFAAAPKIYVANGAVISQDKVLDAAMKGQKVMACNEMELVKNAKSTGISLKNKKGN